MSETEVRSERHRFCPSCGTEAVGAGSFCSECGRSLIKLSADSVTPKVDAVAKADGASPSVNPTWDSLAWDKRIVSELTVALADSGIPHSWDGSVLSTTPEYEAKVDALLDDLSPTWDSLAWDKRIVSELTVALADSGIPHSWDGSVLSTTPEYEAKVDALLDELSGLSPVPQLDKSMSDESTNPEQPTSNAAGTKKTANNDLTGPFRSSPPPPSPSPQPSTVAVPLTQPSVASVPPPLQTPPISPSGKKALRRQPVFWIALGVVVLVIIGGISAAFSSSHSQAYQNGYHYGTLKSTFAAFDGQTFTAKYFCQLQAETNVPVQNSDWVQGCAAALEAINAGTTGTTGNSGTTGSSGNSGNS